MSTKCMDHKQWEVLQAQCQILVKSGFLPPSIKTVEQAITVGLKGWEIDIPLMQAFSGISIIQGKPSISAELMLSLIYKNCKGASVEFETLSDKGCSIVARRPGGKAQTFKFDELDARKAGLINKQIWKQYGRALYRSRCISEMARSLFPDALMGASYVPEELGGTPDMPEYMRETPPPESYQPGESVSSLVKEAPVQLSPSTTKTFDKHNASHCSALNKLLISKGISPDDFSMVYEKMHGKASKELDSVIKEVYTDIIAGDEDDGIPFAPVKSKPELAKEA